MYLIHDVFSVFSRFASLNIVVQFSLKKKNSTEAITIQDVKNCDFKRQYQCICIRKRDSKLHTYTTRIHTPPKYDNHHHWRVSLQVFFAFFIFSLIFYKDHAIYIYSEKFYLNNQF